MLTTLKAGKDRFDWIGFKAKFVYFFYGEYDRSTQAFDKLARVMGESFLVPDSTSDHM